MNWLIRMSQIVRNPPSWQRVRIMLGAIVICILIAGFEKLFGWPEWLSVNNIRRP